jgi:hypothetical protein
MVARRHSVRPAIPAIHPPPHRSPESAALSAAISGIFCVGWNRFKRCASAIVEPPVSIKCRLDSISRQPHSGEISMVITSAHIPAIVALIAGILILIMPRLLNLVVAIYLICIGLIGLGVLNWLHLSH